MCALKRILPFTLTLLIGLALGGLSPLLNGPRENIKFNARGGCYRYFKDAPLRIVYKPEPHYTPEARRHNVTGSVELRMLLHADGAVSDIVPITALPYGLTEESVDAAEGITFVPAIVGGRPVDTIQYVKFDFSK